MTKLDKKWLDCAKSLHEFGVNEHVWSRQNVLGLLKAIREIDIGVLGGDLYTVVGDKITPLGDGWFCEQRKDENEADFFLRSKNEAVDFVTKCTNEAEKDLFFSLVMTEQISWKTTAR